MGQGLNNSIRPVIASNASVFTPLPGFERTYQVELRSTWNRADVIRLCPVQGGETIRGQLTWTGATYVGMLRRETTLMECGVHSEEACRIRMSGEGDVQASGEVAIDSGGGRALDLRWSPARATQVVVEGDCRKAYRDGMARLYRTVTHSILLPLPEPGSGSLEQQLDDYPWKVKVSP
jgi:hypothetical protein